MLALVSACIAYWVVPAHAGNINIVGFGDSLMAGYQLGSGEGFTDRLQDALRERGYDVTVTNAGVSGDTTSGGLSRIDWSVPDGTDLVLLELGANDMLRGIAPQATRYNLEKMIVRLQERSIPVLLIGMMAAPNLGDAYRAEFDPIYPQLAEKYALPLVPFFLEAIMTKPDYLLADHMHPNAEGTKLMVDTVLPVLEPLL